MKTKFAFEVPIPHLEDFEDLQDFHFTLSFLFVEGPLHKEYKNFYKQQSDKALKAVWLDNSFNEKRKSDDHSLLKELWFDPELNFSKVIAPDSPEWNFKQLYKSYQELSKHIPTKKISLVVNTPEDKHMARSIGLTNQCYSYWNRMQNPKYEWASNCHFLGMMSPFELSVLKPPSCDTSMPIKIALRGWTLEDWIAQGCPHIHTHEMLDFFTTILTQTQLDLARRNIMKLKAFVNSEELLKPFIPHEVFSELYKVLCHGELKHKESWKDVPYNLHYRHAQQHLKASLGQDTEVDSGLAHLAHAICRLMFCLSTTLRRL